MTYEIVETVMSEIIKYTDKEGQVYWIPKDEGNSDYQRYLRWLENPDADESGTL